MQKIINFIFNWMNCFKRRARVVAYSSGPTPYTVEVRRSLFHSWTFVCQSSTGIFALRVADDINEYGTVQLVER